MSDQTGPTGQLRYSSIGHASIEFSSSADGVTLLANADGLRSLARLFDEMARRQRDEDHIHLTPALQLTRASLPFVVSHRDGGPVPVDD